MTDIFVKRDGKIRKWRAIDEEWTADDTTGGSSRIVMTSHPTKYWNLDALPTDAYKLVVAAPRMARMLLELETDGECCRYCIGPQREHSHDCRWLKLMRDIGAR